MAAQQSQQQSLQEKLINFEQACKAAGLRLTHQRLEIFQELARVTDHPSAETLHKRLLQRLPTISLDTIYRTLYTFERHDLIKRVQTVQSQARFEAEMMQHHHLICERCKKVIDFQWQSFDGASMPENIRQLGRIKTKNVVLNGICRECLQQDG